MRGDGADRQSADLDEPDDVLLARFAAGAVSAWRPLVERHASAIQHSAWLILRDHAEAEDVAQETFLRLLDKAPRWRPGGAQLRTWLHRVAINLCIDRRRRGRRMADIDLASIDTPAEDPALDRTIDIVGVVGRALDRLPPRQRTAIVLVHYQGMTNIEAAAALGLTVDALESLLARGRRRLRSLIGPGYARMLED